MQFGDNLSEKLSSRSLSAKVIRRDFQGKTIQAKILYIEPIGLFRIINEIVKRLDLTKYSWVKFLRYYLAYLSIIELLIEATWLYHLCVDD